MLFDQLLKFFEQISMLNQIHLLLLPLNLALISSMVGHSVFSSFIPGATVHVSTALVSFDPS